jgi:avirulence protein
LNTLGHVTGLEKEYSYIRTLYAARQDVEPEGLPWGLPPQRRFQMGDEIGGTPISLTAVTISTDPSRDRNVEPYTNLRKTGFPQFGEPFHIMHTAAANIPRIMAHAESLFSHALDPAIGNNEALTTMGELHWWLAHAMPDERGSAAKAEFCVRSMAQARGMDLPPFRHGIVPDLEAMTTPRAEFVHKYPHLLDGV